MKRSLRRQRRQRKALQDISLTPLIDTALTLLIIFMVAAPMMQNAIRITLPKGQAKEARGGNQEIVVYVDQTGKLFFNGTPIADKDLIVTLKKELNIQQDRTVFVKADTQAAYGKVFELVDQIKVVGGVKHVALVSQKHT
ncbi:MAG TPA: biopolymer transporter ExbD [Candidatus Dependentiae bacterium]|nr:biopolymer transporter ExbD [Candidatus Dependentiae bacterium]HRQ62608.1 biopolymer transporter ExbD [Candidatus Dependentiae bacterium]